MFSAVGLIPYLVSKGLLDLGGDLRPLLLLSRRLDVVLGSL